MHSYTLMGHAWEHSVVVFDQDRDVPCLVVSLSSAIHLMCSAIHLVCCIACSWGTMLHTKVDMHACARICRTAQLSPCSYSLHDNLLLCRFFLLSHLPCCLPRSFPPALSPRDSRHEQPRAPSWTALCNLAASLMGLRWQSLHYAFSALTARGFFGRCPSPSHKRAFDYISFTAVSSTHYRAQHSTKWLI